MLQDSTKMFLLVAPASCLSMHNFLDGHYLGSRQIPVIVGAFFLLVPEKTFFEF